MPAAATVLGVEGVLELGQCLRGVLDAEVDDAVAGLSGGVAPEVGDRRVVGIEDEAGAARPRLDGLGPARGQRLHLPVAIELVAEEVAEHDQGGVEGARDLRKPGLVDLEEALVPVLLEQRGGDAPGHVRAGPVVDRAAAVGLQGGGDHPRGRRLAVGGADERRAAIEPRAEATEGLRLPLQQEPPRQGRAAAAAAGPAGGADRARRGELHAEKRPGLALAPIPAAAKAVNPRTQAGRAR